MSFINVNDADRRENIAAVSTLCFEALQILGPNGYLRVRVLLEMIVIELAVDANRTPELDTLAEPSAA